MMNVHNATWWMRVHGCVASVVELAVPIEELVQSFDFIDPGRDAFQPISVSARISIGVIEHDAKDVHGVEHHATHQHRWKLDAVPQCQVVLFCDIRRREWQCVRHLFASFFD